MIGGFDFLLPLPRWRRTFSRISSDRALRQMSTKVDISYCWEFILYSLGVIKQCYLSTGTSCSEAYFGRGWKFLLSLLSSCSMLRFLSPSSSCPGNPTWLTDLRRSSNQEDLFCSSKTLSCNHCHKSSFLMAHSAETMGQEKIFSLAEKQQHYPAEIVKADNSVLISVTVIRLQKFDHPSRVWPNKYINLT